MAFDGSIKIDTKIDDSGISKGLSTITKSVAAAGAAVATGLGVAIKAGSDFEASMSKVGAISGATAEDMQLLTDKAKEMGIQTAFSASEAGEAMQYMAMAGWKTEDMLNGVEGIMNLAAASGENLGTVSDIVTDALTAFGLAAEDSGHFADVLAAASSNANTNVTLMGETFKYVAPVAGSLGYSIEDTAQAIGLMANAGIKGSQAGTALRSIMTRLAKPTKEVSDATSALGVSMTDASGEVKPLSVLMSDLRKSFSKLETAEKASYAAMIAGQEGMSGLLSIVNAAEGDFDKLANAIENADGTAEDMAETMLDNLKGKMTLLGSSLEGLGIAIFEGIEGPLKDAADAGISAINTITSSLTDGELKGALESVGTAVGSLITTLTNLLVSILPPLINTIAFLGENINWIAPILATLTAGIAAYKIVVIATTAAQAAMNAVMMANPIGLAVAGVAALVTGIGALCVALDSSDEAFAAEIEAINEVGESAKALGDEHRKLKEAAEEQIKADISQLDYVKQLSDSLKTLADENGKVAEKDRARAKFIINELNEAMGTEYEIIDGIISKYGDLESSIDSVIEKKRAQIILEGMEGSYEDAIKNKNQLLETQATAYANLQEAEAEFAEAERAHAEALASNGAGETSTALTAAEEKLTAATDAYNTATDNVIENITEIQKYESAHTAFLEDNYDEMNKIINNSTGVYTGSLQEQKEQLENDIKNKENYIASLQKLAEDNPQIDVSLNIKGAEAELSELKTSLDETKQKIRESLPEGFSLASEIIKTESRNAARAAILGQQNSLGIRGGFSTVTHDEIGFPISAGIAEGISDGKSEVVNATAGVTAAAVFAARSNLGIHSPSREFKEIAKMTVDGYIAGLDENTARLVKAQLEQSDDLLDSEKFYLSEKQRLEDEEFDREYNEKIKNAKSTKEIEEIKQEYRLKAQQEGNDKYLDALKAACEQEKEIIESQKKRIADTYTQIAEAAKASLEDIADAQNDLADKLKDYGTDLWETTTRTYEGAGPGLVMENGAWVQKDDLTISTTSLKDLSEDNKKLEAYHNALTLAKQRISEVLNEEQSGELWDILRDMDIDEASQFAHLLAESDEADFNAFIESWKQRQKLASEISEDLYSDDTKRVIEETNQTLIDAYGELPEGFWDLGEDAGENFAEAFIEKLSAMESDIQSCVDVIVANVNAKLEGAGITGGNTSIYNSTYNFASSGETTSQQIASAKNADALDKYRNA